MDTEKTLLIVREMMSQLTKLEQSLTGDVPPASGFPQERLTLVTEGRCLICEKQIEPGTKIVRGTHSNCYNKLMRTIIYPGLKTEEDAIHSGLLLPAESGGRPKDNSLLEKFEAKGIAYEIRESRKKAKKKGSES